jgi:hypothetical protein
MMAELRYGIRLTQLGFTQRKELHRCFSHLAFLFRLRQTNMGHRFS